MDKVILDILKEFAWGDMTMDDFLSTVSPLNDVAIKEAIEVPENLLPDGPRQTKKHEKSHAKVWNDLGIRTKFYRNSKGHYFTVPNDEDFLKYIKEKQINKEQLLDLYEKVATAPEREGLTLDGSDLELKKIFEARRIKIESGTKK